MGTRRWWLTGMLAVALSAHAQPLSRGPHGEQPTPYAAVVLKASDIAALKRKPYRAALVMHTSSDFSSALIAGARKGFAELGISVVAVTDAGMDPQKQRTDLETVMALKPDLIVSLVIDPVSGAIAFRPVVAAGVKLVFISNVPQGLVHGRDYAGIVTDDYLAMGQTAADMLASSIKGKGDVALIYHAANYFVTNQRDAAVKQALARYPGIRVVATRGISNQQDGEVIASAILTQYPKLSAIYAPWDSIAEGVTAAARAAGRRDLKVVTMDLGAANALDMVKGGNMAGIVSDLPYEMGQTVARMGGLALLNRPAPAFVTVDAVRIDSANLSTQWQRALNRELPAAVVQAVARKGAR
ncbi:substrate-binding domain-containing protein [Pseudoduganella danionis]|uniref:Substrate-binding domain-containing protein n=1 Tax=Pseudoduganella danionis TaxID=1890295 RepID=A0ABW9STG8_9BURK|nr:substrate-binding domain-containing protein [Pseudoduganella danionis]MTW35468.1 substrate-binding domain-containing protein [Pseudoduganella danionis]